MSHVSFRYRDALILAAGVEADVDILYTEDVPGRKGFESVRVINLFT